MASVEYYNRLQVRLYRDIISYLTDKLIKCAKEKGNKPNNIEIKKQITPNINYLYNLSKYIIRDYYLQNAVYLLENPTDEILNKYVDVDFYTSTIICVNRNPP